MKTLSTNTHLLNRLCQLLWVFIFSAGLVQQTVAKPSGVSAPAKQSLLIPRSSPWVLSSKSKKAVVHFNVRLLESTKPTAPVFLRRKDEKQSIPMNDLGKDGDWKAGDGISSANVQVDIAKIKADTCLLYEAFTNKKSGNLVSPPLKLCVSSFPINIAKSDLDNPISLSDELMAVADEVLITVAPTISAATIRQLARSVNASIVGSILPLNLYQLKFPAPVNTNQLSAVIRRLRASNGVETASANAIGQGALDVNDPAFDLPFVVDSQHGLKLVLGHIEPGTNAWDGNDRGAQTSVIILDTGIALPHPDLNPAWTCQLANAPALIACTDTTVGPTAAGHGTQVTGVLAAATNNGVGVAGTAFNSKVHSIKMIDFTLAGMAQGFNAARDYIATTLEPFVINASFNIGPVPGTTQNIIDVTALCLAIDQAVFSGGSIVALAVVASGNGGLDGLVYPSRCNDSTFARHDQLDPTRKNLLIPVSNSISFNEATCGSLGLNQRCSSSNHGAWVDMAAPGSVIRTTTLASGYATVTGTSFSAPMVSGAVAILSSCGVSLNAIEAALKGPVEGMPGANPVFVPYPNSGSTTKTPLLNIPLALQRTNCSMVAVDDVLPPIAEDSGVQTISFAALTGNDNDGDSEAVQALTITAVSNPVGGAVSLDGMGNVLFTPTANFNGAASFDYTVQDNGQTNGVNDFKTDIGNVSFPVSAVNDAPVNTVPGAQTIAEDTDLAINGISVVDVDAANVQVTVSTTQGVLSLSGLTGLAFTGGDGTADASMTFSGTKANVNAALNGLVYRGNSNFNGADLISLTTSDLGATGAGGTLTDTDTIAVTISAVNDPPTGRPLISGTRAVGQTLTAETLTMTPPNPIADEDGIPPANLRFNWIRNQGSNGMSCMSIGPVTLSPVIANTHPLTTTADLGCRMSVEVTYIDNGGSAEGPISSDMDASDVGDPHIKTVDGLRYDFQAAGEFVMLRGADGLEIQTRQTPASTTAPLFNSYTGLTVGVSINTAVAARVGKHRVTYQPRNIVSATSGHDLRIDGVLMSLPANGIDLGSGGRITPLGNNVIQIDFPDETTMIVTPGWSWYNVWWLHVNILHTSAYDGLMGYRTKGSWLPRLSDGTSLGARPAAMHDRYVDLYETFANSWRVTDETSLFDYARETSTRTFTLPAWPLEKPPYVIPPGVIPVWAAPQGVPVKPLKRQAALQHCRAVKDKDANANCVFDVMVAGNPGFAKTYLLQQKILAGLTLVGVREDRDTCKPNQPMFVLATVGRHTADTKQGLDKKGTSTRNVLSGTVQFTLNGKEVGKPVKLDGKGHAKMKMPCDRSRQQQVGARFIPAKGSVFLPSSSRNLSSNLETVLRQSKEKRSAN